MKKLIIYSFTAMTLTLTLLGCKDKANEANTSAAKPAKVVEASATKYIVNASESQIEWKGFKPTATHNGIVFIDKGVINTNDGIIASGNFVINMKTLRSLDQEGESKTKLENHLKGTVEGAEGDFFNVNKYPEATFEITSLAAIENGKSKLSGNLTIKGVKNNITFPVKITNEGDDLLIKSDAFTIDRTKWGVNYGSKSVFDNLGDSFINDDIELKVTVKANKA